MNTKTGADDNQVQIPVQNSVNIDYSTGLEKSQAEIMKMSDSEFDTYLKQVQALDLSGGYLPNVDTQKFVFAMGLNGTPKVVDTKTFNSTKGEKLYRTVNWASDGSFKISAPQILDQLSTSKINRIGSGYYGDGHYFANDSSHSFGYGHTRGNIMATAQIRMKLNSNAKIIDSSTLKSQLARDKSASARRIKSMTGVKGYGGGSTDNALAVYAIRKGYNVIKEGGGIAYYNVIDRSVMTLENVYSPK